MRFDMTDDVYNNNNNNNNSNINNNIIIIIIITTTTYAWQCPFRWKDGWHRQASTGLSWFI